MELDDQGKYDPGSTNTKLDHPDLHDPGLHHPSFNDGDPNILGLSDQGSHHSTVSHQGVEHAGVNYPGMNEPGSRHTELCNPGKHDLQSQGSIPNHDQIYTIDSAHSWPRWIVEVSQIHGTFPLEAQGHGYHNGTQSCVLPTLVAESMDLLADEVLFTPEHHQHNNDPWTSGNMELLRPQGMPRGDLPSDPGLQDRVTMTGSNIYPLGQANSPVTRRRQPRVPAVNLHCVYCGKGFLLTSKLK